MAIIKKNVSLSKKAPMPYGKPTYKGATLKAPMIKPKIVPKGTISASAVKTNSTSPMVKVSAKTMPISPKLTKKNSFKEINKKARKGITFTSKVPVAASPMDINKKKVLGSYKKGGTIPKTGIYKLHKGEKVVPKKMVEKSSMNKTSMISNHESAFYKSVGMKKGQ